MKGAFIIVPAFDEADAIEATLAPLLERHETIVVVDDGSTDETWSKLRRLNVHRLRHAINLGQGAALQTGMTYALQNGAEYIVHFDADGQHDPDTIDALLAPLYEGRADVTLGSRFLRHEDAAAVPWAKRVVLKTARFVNYTFTGVLLTDAHNGLRAMTRHAAERIELRANRYEHATELLGQLKGLRVEEVPTRVRYTAYSRAKGQSMLNAVNIVFDVVLGKVFR